MTKAAKDNHLAAFFIGISTSYIDNQAKTEKYW
jgi:hypothetical protein